MVVDVVGEEDQRRLGRRRQDGGQYRLGRRVLVFDERGQVGQQHQRGQHVVLGADAGGGIGGGGGGRFRQLLEQQAGAARRPVDGGAQPVLALLPALLFAGAAAPRDQRRAQHTPAQLAQHLPTEMQSCTTRERCNIKKYRKRRPKSCLGPSLQSS